MLMLIERPGELVTREEICRNLWPDGTFVDFDRSINVALTRLRQVLGDSAENPKFVETVSRRGYRFVASVEAHTPFSAIGTLPPLRSGQLFLDEAEHFLH